MNPKEISLKVRVNHLRARPIELELKGYIFLPCLLREHLHHGQVDIELLGNEIEKLHNGDISKVTVKTQVLTKIFTQLFSLRSPFCL